ncbi:MAG: hypothetical protein ISEC1_P2023 [Thiomicrorhabdus sp.]|nr:MAG: hypothetical protein ISEC1_P2023 [Thiomicrorhabdus sp.]
MCLKQWSIFVILFSVLNVAEAGSAKPPVETVSTEMAADSREAIWVTAEEKAALLSEMRNFLIASQKILQASLTEDMDVVEQAARPVGMKLLKATPKEILKKLPKGFTAIGPKAHQGFEDIADEASGLGGREVVLEKLAKLQTLCNSCHALYRFEVK